MNPIRVRHLDGDRFAISTRGHTLTVDQPVGEGGTDSAVTPTELFVASLASCVAHYAHRYLVRHGLPTEGLSVTATYDMATRPVRVGSISLDVELPVGLPADRREALHAVVSHCTVHNTLVESPLISVTLAEDAVAA